MTSRLRIGIIGAGTSGTFLASLLAQQGHQVDLFERSPQPRTDGCGILLVTTGMKSLYEGNPHLCDTIKNSGAIVQTFEFRNLKDDLVNSESVTYDEDEQPGVLVHRGKILEALIDAVPPEILHLDRAFESVSQTDDAVTVQFRNGDRWQGDVLIGADGIFSRVREAIVPKVEPFYLGDIVWRGIVEDDEFCPSGKFMVYVRGRGIYANFFDIGNGLTHWGFFTETEPEADEVGTPCPKNVAIPPEELAKLPDRPRRIIESTPPDQSNCRFSYDIDPLPTFHNGRILLIGDAAHAKSPTRARGMTAGFEDALALSRYFAQSADIPQILAEFQAERLPIDQEYQRTSRERSLKIGRQRRRPTTT